MCPKLGPIAAWKTGAEKCPKRWKRYFVAHFGPLKTSGLHTERNMRMHPLALATDMDGEPCVESALETGDPASLCCTLTCLLPFLFCRVFKKASPNGKVSGRSSDVFGGWDGREEEGGTELLAVWGMVF